MNHFSFCLLRFSELHHWQFGTSCFLMEEKLTPDIKRCWSKTLLWNGSGCIRPTELYLLLLLLDTWPQHHHRALTCQKVMKWQSLVFSVCCVLFCFFNLAFELWIENEEFSSKRSRASCRWTVGTRSPCWVCSVAWRWSHYIIFKVALLLMLTIQTMHFSFPKDNFKTCFGHFSVNAAQ